MGRPQGRASRKSERQYKLCNIRLPLPSGNYSVTRDGRPVETQLVPLPSQVTPTIAKFDSKLKSQVLSLPGRNSRATQELVFLAEQLQPFGMTTFLVHKGQQEDKEGQEDKSGGNRRSQNDLNDGSTWTMGKEGGLVMEVSSSFSPFRVLDPKKGINMQVNILTLEFAKASHSFLSGMWSHYFTEVIAVTTQNSSSELQAHTYLGHFV